MSPTPQDIRNCPRCGRIFVRVARNLCPQCVRDEDEMITKVIRYLRDHKGAGLLEVVEATGAEEALVLRLIREGRIVVGDAPAIRCERCGRPISEGRFCSVCADELARGLMGAPKHYAAPTPVRYNPNARVHLESLKKRDDTNN